MVDAERELHKRGDCKLCVYTTMGKKEKKPTVFGQAKGSRTIWYLWLGGRYLEYESLGFLNGDHWVSRDILPCGVGGESVNYFGYYMRQLASMGSHFVADDVAGWDTRITRDDLEDELAFIKSFPLTAKHALLVERTYRLLYMNIVALFPRINPNVRSETVMDLVTRGDQRGSGQVVTYALNTITNAKVQLGRFLESRGFIVAMDKELSGCGCDQTCTKCLDTVTSATGNWLNKNGERWLSQMVVAGDDVAVVTEDERFSESLSYINDTGKLRKDISPGEPSHVYHDWEQVEFCSHHYHEMVMKDGRVLIAPCRDKNAVLGRGRVQKGGEIDIKASATNLKAYGQHWMIYFFHRRDLRLAYFLIASVVPKAWMPTGKTTWSIHAKHEWMVCEDVLEVWNKVWIINNKFMNDKSYVSSWQDVPYLPKTKDLQCGSQIGERDRASWAKEIPAMVERTRHLISPGDWFEDAYLNAGRYLPNRGLFE